MLAGIATPKTHRAEKRFQAIIGKLFLVGRHEAGTHRSSTDERLRMATRTESFGQAAFDRLMCLVRASIAQWPSGRRQNGTGWPSCLADSLGPIRSQNHWPLSARRRLAASDTASLDQASRLERTSTETWPPRRRCDCSRSYDAHSTVRERRSGASACPRNSNNRNLFRGVAS